MTKLIGRLKKTILGRITCATLGSRRGGILMEYVVLGVLLTVAVVVAVICFSSGIRGSLTAMYYAMVGMPKEAKTTMEAQHTDAAAADKKSTAHQDGVEQRQ